MQKYQDTVLDTSGHPISGATITVTTLAGAAATIYSDNGTTVITELLTGSDGSFAFYAEGGRYSYAVSGRGITPRSVTDILLQDPASVAITGGTIGGAQFPSVTVASTSASSANTTAIQTALTAGGTVYVMTPGVIYTNATLIYSSNTRLILGQNTTIRQAPNTNKTMLSSSSAVAKTAGGTSVSLTKGVGHAVTVTWTAHGKSVGDGVWIYGALPSVFNGVFRVVSVTDANNFVVYTTYATSSAISGTPLAVAAVKNFHVEGGRWDYDYINNPSPPATTDAHAVGFYGVMDCTAARMWAGNANKYSFLICGASHFSWRDMSGDNRSDLLKIYGPCNGVYGDGLYGTSQDDALSIQTNAPSAFSGYQPSFGDIWDVNVRNVNVITSVVGACCVLYPSDSERMDRVEINGVSGFDSGANPVLISADTSGGTPYTVGVIGDISLKNIATSGNADNIVIGTATIRSLRIEGVTHNPYSQAAVSSYMVSVLAGAQIRLLSIDGGGSAYPASGNFGVVYVVGAVKLLNVSNFSFDNTVANAVSAIYLNTGATVGKVNMQNCYGNTGFKYAVEVAGLPTAAVAVTLRGNKFEGSGGLAVSAIGATVNLALEGNDFAATSLGVVRVFVASAVNIRSDGANTIVGPLVAAGGAPTFTVYGNDLAVDVGALGFVKTTTGQYCFNNGSARGTLVQNRLVTCNGTNWVQVDVPANVF